jgi:hypothetical protein
MDFAFVLLGAVVGALATGGVGYYSDLRTRAIARKAAARAIYHDLIVMRLMAKMYVDAGAWLGSYDWDAYRDTWKEMRAPFLEGAGFTDWVIVHNAYLALHVVASLVESGQPHDDPARNALKNLETSAERAAEIVLPLVASAREMQKLTPADLATIQLGAT